MKVFCTGTSGCGKNEYISDFLKYLEDKEEEIRIFDVGQKIFEKAEELGIGITQEKVLDTPIQTLNALRAAVFEEIKSEVQSIENYIIASHACFRWKQMLIPSFDFYYLNELQPDIYITLIDDIKFAKARLDNTKQWKNKINVKELLIWREEEIFITSLMADYQKKPHYILAKKQPPETLYKFIFKPELKKVYLSYPITHIKDDKGLMKKIEDFYSTLRENFVVFNPLTISDMELIYAVEANDDKKSFVLDVDGTKCEFNSKEIKDAIKDIKSQVVSRDYKLIDQSDMIVVYYPTDLMSPGVLSEMVYASNNNKYVYSIFTERVSPFFEKPCDKIFKSGDEFFKFIKSDQSPI